MKQKTRLWAVALMLSTGHILSMNTPNNTINTIKTIEAVPAYYSNLATQLSAQSPCKGTGSTYKTRKILRLNHWHDCKISEILSINARKTSPEVEQIEAFCTYKNQQDMDDHSPKGIESCIYGTHVPCNPEARTTAYEKIIEILKSNWRFGTPQDYPTPTQTDPTQAWILLMKKQQLIYEPELINHLISKLNHTNIMSCNNNSSYGTDDYEIDQPNDIYLWIKRGNINHFSTTFNFNIREDLLANVRELNEQDNMPIARVLNQQCLARSYTQPTCLFILMLLSLGVYQCSVFK